MSVNAKKKVAKSSVNYRVSAGHRRCGNCVMFHPRTHECDLVAGVINPANVCNRWEAKK